MVITESQWNETEIICEQICQSYDLYTEASIPKTYREIKAKYSQQLADAAYLMAYIKKYPGRSGIAALAVAIASVAVTVAVPVVGYIVWSINGGIVGTVAGGAMGRMINKDYDDLCKKVEQELDKRNASMAQRRAAKRIAKAARRAINKGSKKSVKESANLDYELIPWMY